LGLKREKHLALIYLGEFGMGGASWINLEKFEDWILSGFTDPRPACNYHPVMKEHLPTWT